MPQFSFVAKNVKGYLGKTTIHVLGSCSSLVNSRKGLTCHALPCTPLGSAVSPPLPQWSCVRISQLLIDVKGMIAESPVMASWAGSQLEEGGPCKWDSVITIICGFLWGSGLNLSSLRMTCRACNNTDCWAHPRVSDLGDAWWDPRFCVSNKFSGDAEAAGPEIPLNFPALVQEAKD